MDKPVSYYIEKLNKLEDKLYYKCRQISIDLVQNSIDELMQYQEDPKRMPLDIVLGSLAYKADTVLEVCDRELKDYEIIFELKRILEEK